MLSRDIVRLLVKENPEIANALLPTCRTVHRWIESDKLLMQDLAEHYRKQIRQQLNVQVSRLFHIQTFRGDRDVVNVHLTEGYKRQEYKVDFDSGIAKTGSLGELRTEMTNPQSKDAYNRVLRLQSRSKALGRKFGTTEQEQTVEDICSGIRHVCKAEYKPPFSWERWLRVLVVCMGIAALWLVIRKLSAANKGGFGVCLIMTMVICYAVVHLDFFRLAK